MEKIHSPHNEKLSFNVNKVAFITRWVTLTALCSSNSLIILKKYSLVDSFGARWWRRSGFFVYTSSTSESKRWHVTRSAAFSLWETLTLWSSFCFMFWSLISAAEQRVEGFTFKSSQAVTSLRTFQKVVWCILHSWLNTWSEIWT